MTFTHCGYERNLLMCSKYTQPTHKNIMIYLIWVLQTTVHEIFHFLNVKIVNERVQPGYRPFFSNTLPK